MQKLEEQQVASDSTKDAAAPTKGVLFVRGETQNTDEMGGETKNPEEIELADSDESDSDESESDNNDEEEEKDVPQQKEVPTEVRYEILSLNFNLKTVILAQTIRLIVSFHQTRFSSLLDQFGSNFYLLVLSDNFFFIQEVFGFFSSIYLLAGLFELA